MNRKSILVTAVAVLAMTSTSFAACKDFVQVTPDNAAVFGNVTRFIKQPTTGQSSSFQPVGFSSAFCAGLDKNTAPQWRKGEAAVGFCWQQINMASQVPGGKAALPVKTVTNEVVANNGNVPDILTHRNGIAIPAIPPIGNFPGTPATFIPFPGNAGAVKPGACS